MKKTETIHQHIITTIYYCDNCENQITVISGRKTWWKKGAFQCGLNREEEIGTWCSDKCFKEFENSTPLP